MKKIIIASIISAICVIGCGVNYHITTSRLNSQVVQLESQISDIKNQLDVAQAQQTAEDAKLTQAATGLASDRVSSDNKLAQDFLSKCLTWNSGAEYDAMRAELFSTYGLDENSTFAKTFLPVNVKTEDGQYNYIDTHGANSKFESMTSYVSRISTNAYSYFTYVTWSTADNNGNEAQSTCIFTYDVDANGNLQNLNGYTVSE